MNCITRFAIVVALALCATAAQSASAAVYNETISGDLPGQTNPLTQIAFEVGTNTISGRFGASQDLDSFSFTVPVGTQITAGSVNVSLVADDIITSNWALRTGADYNLGAIIENIVTSVPGSHTLANVPVGAGTYNFSHVDYSDGGVADYTINFTVAPVPEPASLAVLGLGAAALLARRRRGSRCCPTLASYWPLPRASAFKSSQLLNCGLD